jgi:hypothetical protein
MMMTKTIVLSPILTFVFATTLILSGPNASAARFANQFVEFELPARWQCNLEGAEWVCQSTDEMRKRDAIIVLAAKLKGDQDSVDQYLNYLKAPKIYQSVQGKTVKSEAKYAKTVQLNEHTWVDSLHLESELPGFYTRYLATVKQDIGVLVTFSVNKEKYNDYLSDAEAMVNTLKVFRKAGGINAAPAGSNLFATSGIPAGVDSGSVFPTQPMGGEASAPAPSKSEEELPLGLILVGVAVVGYLFWRRRQSAD